MSSRTTVRDFVRRLNAYRRKCLSWGKLPVFLVLAAALFCLSCFAIFSRSTPPDGCTCSTKPYPTVRFTRKSDSVDFGETIRVSGEEGFEMCQDEANTTVTESGKCTFFCVDPSVVGNERSFDVNVEDLMLGDVAATDVHSTERRVLTLQDTFRCEYLKREERPDFDLNKYFHSTDIWISHTYQEPPVITTTDSDGKISRLLPRKTLFWTGEALARCHVSELCFVEQFDELVLLPGMTPEVYWKGIYGPSVAREMAASLKIRNWSMGHQYLAGFNVLLEVNRRLRDGRCARDALCGLPEGEEQQRRLSSTERVTRDVLQSYQSDSPLHLVDLSLSTDPALNTPALVRQRRVERWRARESAIAILLRSCINKRTDQLDRIARYYPVHNYGKCKGKRLINRRIEDLKCGTVPWTPLTVNLTEGRSVGVKSFPLKERYQAVRCVIRHYKYFMVFENTVEKGYVTEKVYNALLGGAVPLVFGTSEVADHVPRPDSIVELLKHFKFHKNNVTSVYQENVRVRDIPSRWLSETRGPFDFFLGSKANSIYSFQCDSRRYPNVQNIIFPSDSEEPYEALGDYLREIEEDDEQLMRLFAWRDMTDVPQWSESFRRIVYGPSPMCNLCAEVLQEKRGKG